MPKFRLEIACDNAAFGDPDADAEIARILLDLCHSPVLARLEGGKLRDANGNTVGEWTYTEE